MKNKRKDFLNGDGEAHSENMDGGRGDDSVVEGEASGASNQVQCSKVSCDKKLKEVMAELTEAKKTIASVMDAYTRVNADFQNFRRRTQQESQGLASHIRAETISELLGVVDDFDRALSTATDADGGEQFAAWLQGFEMVGQSMKKFLSDSGVTEVDCSGKFDPNLHEAILQMDSDEHESGDIVAVVQKGFAINDKVIRPAKVSVAK